MKYLAVFGALALAACSGADTADEPVVAETATATPVAMMAADGMPPEGSYEITAKDGSIAKQTVLADGTYTSTRADGSEHAGTWHLEEPDLWCQTETGETEEHCYHETVTDGVWTSVDAKDETDSTTVVRK